MPLPPTGGRAQQVDKVPVVPSSGSATKVSPEKPAAPIIKSVVPDRPPTTPAGGKAGKQ